MMQGLYKVIYDRKGKRGIRQEFGTSDINDLIKALREEGCYNIKANYIEEYDPRIDFPYTKDAEDYL